MRSANLFRTVQDAISYCSKLYTTDYYIIDRSEFLSSSGIASKPQNIFINLLGVSRKIKTQIIQQSHREYLNGKNIVLICSLSVSSTLFHMLLQIATSVTFIKSRIYDNNKRYDAILVWFVH